MHAHDPKRGTPSIPTVLHLRNICFGGLFFYLLMISLFFSHILTIFLHLQEKDKAVRYIICSGRRLEPILALVGTS
jgi:hypothetical protein